MTDATLELDEEPLLEEKPVVPRTRVGLSKEPPKRRALIEWDYITTLKGFDPYTGEGT